MGEMTVKKYKSAERNPEIDVRTVKEGDFMVISVADNGAGIAEQDLGSIFSKYHRPTEAVKGSGVGLYLVNEIANNAGGKIFVDSELGEGSVFTIFLKLESGNH